MAPGRLVPSVRCLPANEGHDIPGRPLSCYYLGGMTVDLVPLNHLTQRIIGAAIEVHRHLGPGLLESIYQECLARELASNQLAFTREHSAPVIYKDVRLPASYRLDLVVEGVVVVEIKSVASLNAIHQAQILTYMRIADCPVGLLINFNVPRLIDGVMRLVNGRARENEADGENGIVTETPRNEGEQTSRSSHQKRRSP